MKTKTFFFAVAVVALANNVLGQGQVILANNSSTLVQHFGSTPVAIGSTSFQLYFGPAGTPAGFLVPVGPVVGTSTVAAGRIMNTVIDIPTAVVSAGGAATFQIWAWSSSFPSYAAAQSGGGAIGKSAMFTANTSPNGPPPPLPTSLAGLYPGFRVAECLGPYFYDVQVQPAFQTVGAGSNAAFNANPVACPAPSSYQWYFNGAPIAGANSRSYQISNVQLVNAGNYSVEVSNPYWGVHFSKGAATLTVLTTPIITSRPQTQTAEMGGTAGFGVSASGTLPLAYQWLFNGTNVLNGATDPVLQVTNVQSGHAGAYVVVVTNLVGSVTSAPALLSLIPPVERRWGPGLILTGQSGNALNLDAADALVPVPNWAAFDSVLLTNASQWYFDLTEPLPPQRFFRAWQTGVSEAPALDAFLVPALTLTGSAGSTVRLDGINRIGPTDAWFPLATVTLTNTSQLYFDVSVIGQPPRLYRLVQVP